MTTDYVLIETGDADDGENLAATLGHPSLADTVHPKQPFNVTATNIGQANSIDMSGGKAFVGYHGILQNSDGEDRTELLFIAEKTPTTDIALSTANGTNYVYLDLQIGVGDSPQWVVTSTKSRPTPESLLIVTVDATDSDGDGNPDAITVGEYKNQGPDMVAETIEVFENLTVKGDLTSTFNAGVEIGNNTITPDNSLSTLIGGLEVGGAVTSTSSSTSTFNGDVEIGSNTITTDGSPSTLSGGLEVDGNVSSTSSSTSTFSGGINGLPTPTADDEAARKGYVDAVKQGLDIKSSVAVSNHTANIDLTTTTDPNPVDGYTLTDGERVLLKHQTDATENGIYVAQTATDPTTWTRASDFDTSEDANQGAFTYVENGTHKNESYVQLTADPVLGTDPIEFSLFSRAGELTAGNQLSKNGSTLNVSSNPQFSSVNDTSGNTMLNSVVASGQITLSSGLAEFSTNISQTDATFMLALGIDDPNADSEVAGALFWDDSAGNYEIRIRETATSVGNPTVNYDVLRVR